MLVFLLFFCILNFWIISICNVYGRNYAWNWNFDTSYGLCLLCSVSLLFCGFYANTHMSAWLGVTSWFCTGFPLFAFSRIRCIQFALLSWRRFFSDRIDYLLAGVCRSICFGIWFWNLRTSRKYGSDSRLSIEWCHSCASSWFLVSFGFNSEAPDWSSRRASVFSSPFSAVREIRRRL